MKVFKRVLIIAVVVVIIVGIAVAGTYFQAKERDRAKQNAEHVLEMQRKQEQEEKMKHTIQGISGQWKLTYIRNSDGKMIECDIDDKKTMWDVIVEAGIDTGIDALQSSDSLIGKFVGYFGEGLLSEKKNTEPVYIKIDDECIDLNGVGSGRYLFDAAEYETETTQNSKIEWNYFYWLDNNESGIAVTYDDTSQYVQVMQLVNGKIAESGHLIFTKNK